MTSAQDTFDPTQGAFVDSHVILTYQGFGRTFPISIYIHAGWPCDDDGLPYEHSAYLQGLVDQNPSRISRLRKIRRRIELIPTLHIVPKTLA